MKHCLAHLFLATLLLPGAWAKKPAPAATAAPAPTVAPAANVAEAAQPDVFVELRCITLPQGLAIPIIQKFRSALRNEREDAVAQLEKQITLGTAKLLGWPIVKTHAAKEASVDDIEEIHYARTFSPGSVNVYLNDENGNLTKQPSTVSATDVEPVATEFESRNVGVTLTVNPTIDLIGRIDVNLQAQHCHLTSIDRITVVHESVSDRKTEKVTQEQPRFLTMKVSSTFSVQSGEQTLIGIFKAPGENQVELFVLGAVIEKPAIQTSP